MNPQHQRRADILIRLAAGTLSIGDGAELLGISERQVRRLRDRYRAEGMGAVVHGNQGRGPVNRTDLQTREHLRTLVGGDGPYHDFNVCHLQELLATREGLTIGRSTLDRLLKQEGLRQPRREQPRVVHRRRERRQAAGMLLQMDASPHDWLEGRGPPLTLVGSIDDATNQAVYLHFQPTEDQDGYIRLLRTIAQTHGLPTAVYHDRHTILRSPKQPTLDDELAGRLPQSQIQRIIADLGIEAIAALSPQAKGRIERLWETLQDRLIKEMRLAHITTPAEANAFLPAFLERFNARFGRAPADPRAAFVPLPADTDLAYYFAVRETRTVRADHCVQWQGTLLQLVRASTDPSLARHKIQVHVVPEGEIYVYDGTQRLAYQVVIEQAQEQALAPVPVPARSAAPAPRATAPGQRAWLYGTR